VPLLQSRNILRLSDNSCDFPKALNARFQNNCIFGIALLCNTDRNILGDLCGLKLGQRRMKASQEQQNCQEGDSDARKRNKKTAFSLKNGLSLSSQAKILRL
jgi:hypothetical protein